MSEENVELVRRITSAFHAGDWTTALEGYGETAELDMSRIPGGDIYHGRQGIREFFTRWIGSWDRFEAKTLDLVDGGDSVVLVSEISGIGKGSGAEVTMRSADVFFVVDGSVVRHVGYPDASEALEAAGLRE